MYDVPSKIVVTPSDWIVAGKMRFNLYRSIIRCKNVPYTKVKSHGRVSLLIDGRVLRAIRAFESNGGYAGLRLDEYLTKTFERADFASPM